MKKLFATMLVIALTLLILSACAGIRPGGVAPIETMEDAMRLHRMLEKSVEGVHKAKRILDFLTK